MIVETAKSWPSFVWVSARDIAKGWNDYFKITITHRNNYRTACFLTKSDQGTCHTGMAGEAMFLAHLISKLTHRDNTSTSTYSKFVEYIYSSFDDIAMNVSNDCELGPAL